MTVILDIQNLDIAFVSGKKLLPVVKNVNLQLKRGHTIALVGESGGGKSLIASAIMQLIPVTARIAKKSRILLQQKDLLKYSVQQMQSVRGRKIAMIFQEALIALNPVFTIGEQIEEVLRCHFTLSRQQRKTRILTLLQEVGIEDTERCARSYPHQLSGGQRQRAMIAMALAGEPEILIADEPTSAVDVTIAAQIMQLLKKLQQEKNMSLLFITHDLAMVAKIADEVAVIYRGEIIEQQPLKDFLKNPQQAYSRLLFEALPQTLPIESRTTSAAKPLLTVKDLKIYFPIQRGIFKRTVGYVKAVDGVNFTLYAGKTLALVGESGSGKTTIAKAILRLIKPSHGEIHYENRDIVYLTSAQIATFCREIQLIFQDPYTAMDPRFRIQDVLTEGLAIQKIGDVKTREQRVAELLAAVGLPLESATRYPHEFSGGQRQRICIARSLAFAPKIIVCDEPTSALDVISQLQILKLLKQLQQQFGITYIIITHNFFVVRYLADEVAVLHKGKMVEYGSTQAILHNPQQAYTKQLLAAVNWTPNQQEGN